MLSLLKTVLRRLSGRPAPAVAVSVHPFDSRHGVETSGLLERQQLQTGHANDASNTAYFGVPPSRFANAVARWRATPATPPVETYRFVDIGCGKGRAVLLASRMGFRDVVGLELHPELAALAQTNLAHWQRSGATAPTSIICADAPTALPELLGGPVLLYVYNPFRAPVLRQLLQAVLSRTQHVSGPVDVLYLYPEHEDVFAEFPAFRHLWQEQVPLDAADAGDGISAVTDPCSLYRLPSPGAAA